MPDLRRISFVVLSSVLLLGTIYSVKHHTYLDTSDPLLALGQRPHPLHDAYYFAQKTNVLNTVFIKNAWGWTSLAALALGVTAARARATRMSAWERVKKWSAATVVWLVFTSWFFGPALFARLTSLSGGECVVRLPSGSVHTVPTSFCYERTILSPATHPELFDITPLLLDDLTLGDWNASPRLMRGHDVSGHVFLLTMSLLFLADMLQPSLRLSAEMRPRAHNWAMLGTATLMWIWVASILTTSVFFHTPFEKLTGYLLGLAGFLFTQLRYFRDANASAETARTHED